MISETHRAVITTPPWLMKFTTAVGQEIVIPGSLSLDSREGSIPWFSLPHIRCAGADALPNLLRVEEGKDTLINWFPSVLSLRTQRAPLVCFLGTLPHKVFDVGFECNACAIGILTMEKI
jgi:hypothetical protein